MSINQSLQSLLKKTLTALIVIALPSLIVACGGGGSNSGGGGSSSGIIDTGIIAATCLPTFTATDCAAFLALNKINPVSQAENCEYGGIVYEDSEGAIDTANENKGGLFSVSISGTTSKGTLIADYHTHPRRLESADFFSVGDKDSARRLRHPIYLATGFGNFKRYDYVTDTSVTLSKISTKQDPPFIPQPEDRCEFE